MEQNFSIALDTLCSVKLCTLPGTAGRGYCSAHYSTWRRHGTPTWKKRKIMCKIPECVRPAFAKEMCKMHYSRKDPYVKYVQKSTITGRHDKEKIRRGFYATCPLCTSYLYSVKVHTTIQHEHITIPLKLKYCITCKYVMNFDEVVETKESILKRKQVVPA